jgi:hypothetical protein
MRFGLAKESVRGTAEAAPTKWYPVMAPEIAYGPTLLPDTSLRGVRAELPPIAGRKLGTGKFKMILDAQTIGEFMYSLLGGVASTEQSVITIGASNNKLDFNIGAGELTATIANAAYPIGTAHTQAGTLCKAIYDAIVAAEAVGTYTVAYSRTTKKFTITRSAGTLSLLWNTGTNKAATIGTTLGYALTSDDTAAISYTGDSEVAFAFSHALTVGTSIQPPSYTFFVDYGISVKKYNRCVVKSLGFSGPVDNLITVDVEFLFGTEASGDMGSPVFPSQKYLSFQHAAFKRAGTTDTDVKNWSLKIDNGAKALQTLAQSQDIQDIVTPDPLSVSGECIALFQSETERAKFLANTSVAIRSLIEGEVISGAFKMTVDIPLTDCRYKGYPLSWEDNLLAAKVEFTAYHNGTSQILPILINTDAAY